jgi:pimeloyl-[acyl-carrier protein] methyl ester esterase
LKRELFELPDGGHLTWYEEGDGRPLVLLHGWAMSASVFNELVPMLADDFRLLIPDLPGHGTSSPAAQNDLESIGATLNRWLEATESAPVALGGWSLGGMIAMEMARQNSQRINRLLLIGTTPRFTSGDDWTFGLPEVQVRALSRNLARRFESTLADFFNLAFAGEDIPEERLRIIRNFAVKRSSPPDRTVAMALLNGFSEQNQIDLLPHIDQPTLVVHGELDQITPLAAGHYLAERLPNGELFEIPGVGHGPFLSRPKELVDRILEFC